MIEIRIHLSGSFEKYLLKPGVIKTSFINVFVINFVRKIFMDSAS